MTATQTLNATLWEQEDFEEMAEGLIGEMMWGKSDSRGLSPSLALALSLAVTLGISFALSVALSLNYDDDDYGDVWGTTDSPGTCLLYVAPISCPLLCAKETTLS